MLRTTIQETQDSDHFREALQIWAPAAATKRGTPRAVKRFGNHLLFGVRLPGDPQIIRPATRVSTRAKDRKSK